MASFSDPGFDSPPAGFPVPAGHAVYQVDDGQVGLYLDGAQTQMRPLKPDIRDKVMRLHRRVVMDFIFSAATTLLVYALIISLIVILPATATRHLTTEELIVMVILACIAVPMYGFFSVREGCRLRSIIAHVLHHQMSQEEINKLLFDRTKAAPEISFKISLKRGAISREEPNHWTQTDRFKSYMVTFSSWQDHSLPVRDLPWPESRSAWIIVAKNFCTRNKPTDQSISSDISRFKKQCMFDDYLYFMEAQYVLEFEDLKSCDDWELYFVYYKHRPVWTSLRVYQLLCFLSLDSLYRVLFHCATKYLDEFYITKTVER